MHARIISTPSMMMHSNIDMDGALHCACVYSITQHCSTAVVVLNIAPAAVCSHRIVSSTRERSGVYGHLCVLEKGTPSLGNRPSSIAPCWLISVDSETYSKFLLNQFRLDFRDFICILIE